MEEAKTKTKTKSMSKKATVEEAPKQKKLSYEELENIANQLSNQAKTMYDQLQKANLENMFKRIDFLFKVVENQLAFDDTFIEKCTKEIESLLTLPEKEEQVNNDTDSSQN